MDNRVYLAACDEYEKDSVREAVKASLACFGGASALAGKGKRVLIKPNLLMPRNPNTMTTTHPFVVEALAYEFIESGAEVIIADSPGGPYNPAILKLLYNACGMTEVAKNSGAKLNFDISHKNISYKGFTINRTFPVITPATQADLIISAAKLKTHSMAFYSGAVKNMFGCIPGLIKAQYHSRFPEMSDFCAMLIDLCNCVAPGLSIIDGVYGMEGLGPSGGTPKKAGIIVSSLNPHAADLCAASLVSLDSRYITTLRLAASSGLIPEDISGLNIAGADPALHKTTFTPPHNYWGRARKSALVSLFGSRFLRPYPKIVLEKCVGCGKCAEICPKDVIRINEGKAEISYKSCIKCYCCHEMCPVKAIEFSRRKGKQKA